MSSVSDGSAARAGVDLLQAVQAALATWRAAHPHATFAEIEAVVEQQLGRLRAQLIAEAVAPAAAQAARPTCADCRVPMTARGVHPRTLRIPGDQPVTLERSYWTCPRCGGGVFPPG